MADPEFVERQASPLRLGGLTVRQLARRVWQEIREDDVFGRSAQLAYYFFFAIFPLFIFLTALLGLLAGPGSAIRGQLVDWVTRAMPPSASGLVQQTVHHTLDSSGRGKLGIGIFFALLSASAGMGALMGTLNVVFGARERRSFFRRKATAMALTIATGLLICLAIGLILVGGHLANALFGGALRWVWQMAQYPAAILFLLVSYSLIYYLAPNVARPRWHWLTPGAAVGVFLWLAASFGLRVYLQFSNKYTATYGTLGAVMILLLWFYVSGIAVLIGGEVNSVIERATTGQPKPKAVMAEAVRRDRPAA